jgi:hypothetical protein
MIVFINTMYVWKGLSLERPRSTIEECKNSKAVHRLSKILDETTMSDQQTAAFSRAGLQQ